MDAELILAIVALIASLMALAVSLYQGREMLHYYWRRLRGLPW